MNGYQERGQGGRIHTDSKTTEYSRGQIKSTLKG